MAMSRLSHECFEGELFVGTYSLGFHRAEHAKCSGGETTPGVFGGWRCNCDCHRSSPLPAATQPEKED